MSTEKIAKMTPHTQVTGYSGGEPPGQIDTCSSPLVTSQHWQHHPISMTSPTGSNWEGGDGNQRRPVGRYGMCMEPMGVD